MEIKKRDEKKVEKEERGCDRKTVEKKRKSMEDHGKSRGDRKRRRI